MPMVQEGELMLKWRLWTFWDPEFLVTFCCNSHRGISPSEVKKCIELDKTCWGPKSLSSLCSALNPGSFLREVPLYIIVTNYNSSSGHVV